MKDDPRNHTNGHEQEVTNEKMIDRWKILPFCLLFKRRIRGQAGMHVLQTKRDEGAPPLFVPLCGDPTYRSSFRGVEDSWTSFCERHASLAGNRERLRVSHADPAATRANRRAVHLDQL